MTESTDEREALIAHARHIASVGTQEDDGYIYQVSSRELADYARTIHALVDLVGSLRGDSR